MAQRTPLYDAHDRAGARFTDFGGWEMPVSFDSIRAEHRAVRESVGRFDVSHMGEVAVSGPDARDLTQRLTTNDVAALAPGEAQYSLATDEAGVIIDDTLVYRPPADVPEGAPGADADYLFVPNAGHDAAAVSWWREHREEWDLDATVTNRTGDVGLLAVQGPDAVEHLAATAPDGDAIRDLDRFEATGATVAGRDCLVSRTGYTGEDGVEVFCPWGGTADVWGALDCPPCGLGARDTLRTEMGYLLAGQEFDAESNPRNPYEAGVGFAVDLDTAFVGRDALAAVEASGVAERLVGFLLGERGVPRHGYELRVEGVAVGTVTSGTMSPTLGEPIGLGYLPAEHAAPDTELAVVVRGDPKSARVVALPFL
jgi:aminomethyltransferase